VNLVLITAEEAKSGLNPDDPRARHLRETVGLAVGGTFHVGVTNSLRGIATITALAPQLTFAVAWEKSLQARLPLAVLVGLPRPQTAKKILHDLASLGAARIVFFESAKGDPGYLASSLWKDGEWREHVLKGTEQACSTLVPEVTRVGSLAEALVGLDANAWKLALDPYAATGAPEISAPAKTAVLAIGPERGFADEERAALRTNGFAFAHLGDRILRVEAAALVGGALMLAQLRVWEKHQSLGG
jgi:RsmE family RNA methyltransferase